MLRRMCMQYNGPWLDPRTDFYLSLQPFLLWRVNKTQNVEILEYYEKRVIY